MTNLPATITGANGMAPSTYGQDESASWTLKA